MSKNNKDFYFESFKNCSDIACSAAKMLHDILSDFHAVPSDEQLEKLHEIEHKGDLVKHEMMEVLVKAFITPIDREDIVKLSESIDNVTDSIEDIIIQMHIAGITSLRDDCLKFANLLIESTDKMKELVSEFENFRKSKTLKDIIIEINRLEEEGDKLYLSAMTRLHSESKDVLHIVIWREIYTCFEKVSDSIEDVSEIIESTVIENL